MGCVCTKKERQEDCKIIELHVDANEPPIDRILESDKNHKSHLEIDEYGDALNRTNMETNIYRNKQSTYF